MSIKAIGGLLLACAALALPLATAHSHRSSASI